jgi:hypothetical protein
MSATNSNVFINLITDYQNKGVQQAQQSLGGFEQLAKKAAVTFAGVFSAQKIVEFGKASVDAFAQDQKALALLDQTLSNMGLGYATKQVAAFTDQLSLTYGVAKEDIIPAFETLARYTGSVGKAQDLTNLALNVSAGTGKDLATVSTALAKAYSGQYTALGKLGTGLSKADLASKNFSLIQGKLTSMFKGDAARAADTYEGKVARLKVGFKDMQVQIGAGLVDAFSNLIGGTNGIDAATTAMHNFGEEIGNAITGLGVLLGKLHLSGVLDTLWKASFLGIGTVLKGLAKIGADSKKTADQTQAQADAAARSQAAQQAIAEKKAKALADAQAKADRATLDAKNKQLALDKAALSLKQASKTFDVQAAEVYAANAQAKDASDKARLQLMGDQIALQTAIDNKDATLATNLAARVQQDLTNLKTVQASVDSIKSPENPLQSLQDALDQGLKTLDEMVAAYQQLTSPITPNSALAVQAAAIGTSVPAYAYNNIASGQSPTYAGSTLADMPAPVVNVQLDGQALAANVSQWLQDISASGSSTATLSRNNNPVINP